MLNGEENKKRISWVSWPTAICKPKLEGGLGVQHCELFNIALRSKWAWKFPSYANLVWYSLLTFKYGDIKGLILDPSWLFNSRKSSVWWKDLRLSIGYYGRNRIGLAIAYNVNWEMAQTLILDVRDGLVQCFSICCFLSLCRVPGLRWRLQGNINGNRAWNIRFLRSLNAYMEGSEWEELENILLNVNPNSA